MNPRQALRVRQRITTGLLRAVLRELGLFSGKRVSRPALSTIHRRTRPLVVSARQSLQLSANQQYRLFVQNADVLPPVQLTRFTPDTWMNSIEKVFDEEEDFTDELAEQLGRKADWWARDAERGTLIDYTDRDERIGRWARYDPEPPACDFCTVLISRGAVYTSKEAAGMKQQAEFHTGCTCEARLIAPDDIESFQETPEVQAAIARYKAGVAKANSGNINDIVAAMHSLRSEKG